MTHSGPARPGDTSATIRLAVPIIAAYLADQMLGFVDTLIAGRLGEAALAAVGIGNAIFTGATILGIGLITGLDPIVSQAVGAQRNADAVRALASALVTAAILAVPFALCVIVGSWASQGLGGLDAATGQGVVDYLGMRVYAVAPLYLQAALGSFLQGHGNTKPLFISAVLVNCLNVPLSLALSLGEKTGDLVGMSLPWLGEGSGVAGIGLATSIVSAVRFGILAAFVWRYVPRHFVSQASLTGARLLCRVGLPIGLHWLAEVGVFVVATLAVARFGTNQAAGHQIALQMATLTFMFALGLGAATGVRVGQAVGRRDTGGIWHAGKAGLQIVMLAMGLSAGALAIFAESIARLFTDSPAVIAAAVPLLRIAAIFQFADGVQAVMAGAMRGAGDTRASFLLNASGHWLVGVPSGLLLGFVFDGAARGLWWGLCIGLTLVAVGMTVRFYRRSRTGYEPVESTAT
ncbi:MAG: MATE family efflux transporter [Myxococcota bacterium]|nr:MATE family efflux transporter [Myxococcota bacterium]